jgi:hypothetical protein
MPELQIAQQSTSAHGYAFAVTLPGHEYNVRLSEDYYQKLTAGRINPAELVRRSFAFLLAREDAGSILREFDLPLINTYFPEYEQTMRSQSGL